MQGKRRLHHESLESRRLLAASCLPAEPSAAGDDALQLLDSAQISDGVAIVDQVRDQLIAPIFEHFLSHGPDLVQEHGNQLIVVDQLPFANDAGSLFVFERTTEGTLEQVAEVKLDFAVDQMIVHGDQVLLFGNDFDWPFILAANADGTPVDPAAVGDDVFLPHHPATVVATVNLGSDVQLIRQEFEGVYHQLHQQGDRIVMLSSVESDVHIAIYPPPAVTGLLRTFEITSEGLLQVGSLEIPLFGMTGVHDQDFYSATTSYPDIHYLLPPLAGDANTDGIVPPDPDIPRMPFVSVSKYFLADDGIRALDTIELGQGYLMNFQLSPDGLTAIAVRSEFLGAGPATVIELLDLSGEEVRVFESIRLQDFNGQTLVTGPDHVVLRSYDDNTLVVIDANQSIDLAAENRVRRVEIPNDLHLHYDFLHVSPDRLVLRANRLPVRDDDGVNADITIDPNGTIVAPDRIHETVLLTVSISEAHVIADTHLPGEAGIVAGQQFVLIDAKSERFGFTANRLTTTDVVPRFVYGQLSDSGEFVTDGQIPMVRWLEIDANADRLIARQSDTLLEYDWDNTEEPTVTPLGEPDPLPEIEAFNDQYRLNANGEDHVLDVLANDVIHHRPIVPRAEIVELIGAPEGAEIVDGNMVRIPAEALEGVETLRFEYVISDGQQRSSAVVEIDVQSISEDQVAELVEAIRRRAADDFGVSIDEVEITFVEKIFNDPLPVVLPNDPVERFSPGVLVTLTVPDATAMYAANFEGEILQVFAWGREYLMELGLRAVDDSGQELEQVTEGQNFWLEFNAKDLREWGGGVYAAFFDLVVPTEHLVITGPVEFGPGFVNLPGGEFSEGEINELGGLSDQIEAPGNEQQQILRIGAQAVGAGEVKLRVNPADDSGSEPLLRGRDTEVPHDNVRYTSLTLNIVPAAEGDPLDADGNGILSAADALVVINFLGQYGSTSLTDLVERVRAAGAEGEEMTDQQIAEMRRLDTNSSGEITALDALVIVNGLQDQIIANDMAAAEQVSFPITTLMDDDDEEE